MGDVQRIAVWRQIEDALSGEIVAGRWPAGRALPGEFELAERFAVNRHTVRRALAALQARGLVRVAQGRGTFVAEDLIDYVVGRRTRFTENIARQNRQAEGEILKVETVASGPEAARALGLSVGAALFRILRLGYVDRHPVMVTSHHFAIARVPDLACHLEGTGSITQALAACGIHAYSRASSRVTARLPSEEDARLLRQPVTQPILYSENVNVDGEGRPLEYALGRYAGNRVQVVFEP